MIEPKKQVVVAVYASDTARGALDLAGPNGEFYLVPSSSPTARKGFMASIRSEVAVVVVTPDDPKEISSPFQSRNQRNTRSIGDYLEAVGHQSILICVDLSDHVDLTADGPVYSEATFQSAVSQIRQALSSSWLDRSVLERVVYLPFSSDGGENLRLKTTKMPWWQGVNLTSAGTNAHAETLFEALEGMIKLSIDRNSPLVLAVEQANELKSGGLVISGTLFQGTVSVGDEVAIYHPFFTKPFTVKVIDVAVRRVQVADKAGQLNVTFISRKTKQAEGGDQVGITVSGFKEAARKNETDAPSVSRGCVVVKTGFDLAVAKSVTALMYIAKHPGPTKSGYTTMFYGIEDYWSGKMACLYWKSGAVTAYQKVERPPDINPGELVELEVTINQPSILANFSQCRALSRFGSAEPECAGRIIRIS